MNNNERVIVATADGSLTVSIPSLGITYHSMHGALRESDHIFIQNGLQKAFADFPEGVLRVFEMGFGTGLNALLTAEAAALGYRMVDYTAVELYPLSAEELQKFASCISNAGASLFSDIHHAGWSVPVKISGYFILQKLRQDLLEMEISGPFHLIYYDAFSPESQPHLWQENVFRLLYDAMVPGGILVTYCSKSIVRKAMQAAGFSIEKIPGPRGKREIVRATRL